jgi:hypothetical protein
LPFSCKPAAEVAFRFYTGVAAAGLTAATALAALFGIAESGTNQVHRQSCLKGVKCEVIVREIPCAFNWTVDGESHLSWAHLDCFEFKNPGLVASRSQPGALPTSQELEEVAVSITTGGSAFIPLER